MVLVAAACGDDKQPAVDSGGGTDTGGDVDGRVVNAGVTVNPTSGLTTTEAGGTATFTVVLDDQPLADVTIALSSSDTGEGTVDPATLTFTNANWDAPQTVTITGVDDGDTDGDQTYMIVTAATTSTDAPFDGLDVADVSVSNTDNDVAGITVTPTTGLMTSESGQTATFTIVLNTMPTANVTIPLSSSTPTEGTVSPASVTFTTTNWNAPQTVTVTGVNDNVTDGAQSYTILTAAATSTDTRYAGLDADDVAVSNIDNDTPGITVNPTTGLTTRENGTTATFQVRLNTQPTANVTIGLSSSDTGEGTVSPATLTFTTANWNAFQTVTVTGVNDAPPVADGDQMFMIVTAAAQSTDANYNGVNAADVSVTNQDDDTAGFTVAPTSITVAETGTTATFTVRLNTQPSANVAIGISSSDTGEGTVSPATLTFTPANFGTAQTVTVTGVDDAMQDNDQMFTIVTAAATSTDAAYSGRNPADVAVTNIDNDTPRIRVSPLNIVTREDPASATFTIRLDIQPTANVTIGLSSSDTTEGTVTPASVTFTTANWNTPQTVTIAGVDDNMQDGDQSYTIVTAAASSTDPRYNGMNADNVSATNIDNDTPGVTVTPLMGLVTTETGGTDTYTVRLNSAPTANVTITVTSGDATEGTASPGTLTFTSANWNVAQTVTVTGVNDTMVDGDIVYTVANSNTSSTDLNYTNLPVPDVTVTNRDDEGLFVVTPISGLTTTEAGGTDTFTVRLFQQPTANVTFTLSSSAPDEGTVSPTTLTFTPVNWNTNQTVTVTGVNDAIDDGTQAYSIVTAAATSADANYNGQNPPDVGVTNSDDADAAGFTTAISQGCTPAIAPTTAINTSEAATMNRDCFTVRLNSEPTGNVVITVVSSAPDEGTVSAPSLTFTAANWNMPQTVIVTGVNDNFDDGNINYNIQLAVDDAASNDATYEALANPGPISATNVDDDTFGIIVTPATITTTEAGGTATISVRLGTQPTNTVTIAVASDNVGEATVDRTSLTFTAMNYATPQVVTVTGVNDLVDDGNQAYAIEFGPATGGDYAGETAIVDGTNTDNDTAGFDIVISPAPCGRLTTTTLETAEQALQSDCFQMRLNTEPSANVTISIASSDPTEGQPDKSQLTFTPQNWNAYQVVTVSGIEDVLNDNDITYSIVTGTPVGATEYSTLNPMDIPAVNADND